MRENGTGAADEHQCSGVVPQRYDSLASITISQYTAGQASCTPIVYYKFLQLCVYSLLQCYFSVLLLFLRSS
jgi:hypothetical protein